MSITKPKPPVVLTFAGADPTSGAGIQADLLTCASIGCYTTTVITAITVQDTTGVSNIIAIDSEIVTQQARAILEDMEVAVFKIGMLGSVENIIAIADILADYPEIPVILDPILASGRGDDMTSEDIIAHIREVLLPEVNLITPNSLEARRLVEFEEDDESEVININDDDELKDQISLKQCANRLMTLGVEYVLITGTHENTHQVINSLYGEKGLIREDRWKRLPHSYHGSGCTLASAIAGLIAQGIDIEDAVYEAQEYTWKALENGFQLGMGQHLPDRFFWLREDDELKTNEIK